MSLTGALPGAQLRLALAGGRTRDGWQGALETLDVFGSEGRIWDGALTAPANVGVTRRDDGTDLALRNLHWRGGPGEVRVAVLQRTAGRWQSRGGWQSLPLRTLLDAGAAAAALRGPAGDLRLAASWDLAADSALTGQLRLSRQDGDARVPGADGVSRPLGLASLALDVDLAGRQLRARAAAGGPTLGQATAEVTAALAPGPAGWGLAPAAPLQGSLALDLPRLDWVGPVVAGPGLQLSGRLAAEATLAGSVAAPRLRGQVSGDELGMVWRDEGIQLQSGRLRASLDETTLRVHQLRLYGAAGTPPAALSLPAAVVAAAANGGGVAELSGALAWADQRGRFDLRAEHFAVLQRPDLWLIASGRGTAELAPTAPLRARGQVTVDAAAIRIAATAPPRLGDDVVVMGATPPPREGVAVDAALTVDFGEAFQFSGRGLSGRIAGQLNLTQRPGEAAPRAVGSLELKSGRFDAYGQTLNVVRGLVNFQGPLDDPGLNVLAVRPDLPVTVGVRVAGSVRQPRVSLYSEEPMSDPEKLSWVVLGRGSEAGSGADASTLMAAARALFQGRGDGPGGALAGALGFDELRIGDRQRSGALVSGSRVAQTGGSATVTPADQVLVVGKRLSATTSVAFEQTLSGVGTVLRLTQQLSRSLSVTARTGVENALSIHWGKSYR